MYCSPRCFQLIGQTAWTRMRSPDPWAARYSCRLLANSPPPRAREGTKRRLTLTSATALNLDSLTRRAHRVGGTSPALALVNTEDAEGEHRRLAAGYDRLGHSSMSSASRRRSSSSSSEPARFEHCAQLPRAHPSEVAVAGRRASNIRWNHSAPSPTYTSDILRRVAGRHYSLSSTPREWSLTNNLSHTHP